MNQMPVWEQALIAVVTVLVVLWFRPGLKAALEQSRQAQHKDWQSLLLPLGLVILFVSNSKFGFYPVLAGSISSCSAIKAIKWDQLSKKRYLVRVVKS